MSQYLSNLPIGALVTFGRHSVGSEGAEPIVWRIADKNHNGYPSDSVTLIADKIIDLRAFDALEVPALPTGNVNYTQSNINTWLNSDANANEWYYPTNEIDTPPSGSNVNYGTAYQSRPGFLYNFTAEEKRAILPTTIGTQAGSFDPVNIVAKVFIPSAWEIKGVHNFPDGSSRFSYFTTGAVTSSLTPQAYSNTLSTVKPATEGANWTYMTRSSQNTGIACVNDSGGITYTTPYDGSVGIRPALNLPGITKISDDIDVANGAYRFITQTAPVISEDNRDLGIMSNAFSLPYTVSDADGDTVTVTEYVDNVLLRTYVVTPEGESTFEVTGKTWLALANGNHTLKILATDGFEEVTRTFTFTKSITSLVVQRITPIASSVKPTNLIVTVVKNIPYNAEMKVEACNNGFDASPAWEDITDSVTSGLTHVFANTIKTASEWGVNIRVTVDRNGSEGACYITEIGGNFE